MERDNLIKNIDIWLKIALTLSKKLIAYINEAVKEGKGVEPSYWDNIENVVSLITIKDRGNTGDFGNDIINVLNVIDDIETFYSGVEINIHRILNPIVRESLTRTMVESYSERVAILSDDIKMEYQKLRALRPKIRNIAKVFAASQDGKDAIEKIHTDKSYSPVSSITVIVMYYGRINGGTLESMMNSMLDVADVADVLGVADVAHIMTKMPIYPSYTEIPTNTHYTGNFSMINIGNQNEFVKYNTNGLYNENVGYVEINHKRSISMEKSHDKSVTHKRVLMSDSGLDPGYVNDLATIKIVKRLGHNGGHNGVDMSTIHVNDTGNFVFSTDGGNTIKQSNYDNVNMLLGPNKRLETYAKLSSECVDIDEESAMKKLLRFYDDSGTIIPLAISPSMIADNIVLFIKQFLDSGGDKKTIIGEEYEADNAIELAIIDIGLKHIHKVCNGMTSSQFSLDVLKRELTMQVYIQATGLAMETWKMLLSRRKEYYFDELNIGALCKVIQNLYQDRKDIKFLKTTFKSYMMLNT